MYPLKASLFFLICNPTVNIWNSILVYKKQRNLHGRLILVLLPWEETRPSHQNLKSLHGRLTGFSQIFSAAGLNNTSHSIVKLATAVETMGWTNTFQRQAVWSLWLPEPKEQVHPRSCPVSHSSNCGKHYDALILFFLLLWLSNWPSTIDWKHFPPLHFSIFFREC